MVLAMIIQRGGEADAPGERAIQRLAAFQELTAELSLLATHAEIASVVLTKGAPALGASGGLVALCAVEGKPLEIVGTIGHDPGLERTTADGASPVQRAIRTRGPVFDERAAAVPLCAAVRVMGGLSFSFDAPRPFDEGERTFLLTLARQCAQALDRALLQGSEREARERAERLVDRTRRLERVNGQLARALTAAEVAGAIIDEGTSALDATMGALWRISEDGAALDLVKSAGMPAEAVRMYERLPLDSGAP